MIHIFNINFDNACEFDGIFETLEIAEQLKYNGLTNHSNIHIPVEEVDTYICDLANGVEVFDGKNDVDAITIVLTDTGQLIGSYFGTPKDKDISPNIKSTLH